MNMSNPSYHPVDQYEYHGHTVVEQVRRGDGEILWRRWLLFDSVEEAQEFYYGQAESPTRGGMS